MLIETIVAIILLICVSCFAVVNLHNILIVHRGRENIVKNAEVNEPSGVAIAFGAIGTFIYAVEALAYLFLVFSSSYSLITNFPFSIRPSTLTANKILGTVMTVIGYSIFIWSVIARGKYSVSWKMPEDQKLVTWGPYHYVRHPSYLGYFLMFTGMILIWTNIFTLPLLVAIPGYYKVTMLEEELLTRRFGEDYREYQRRTGRFIPKIRR
jgi:protein-S-isoprenylcysteine O-methyltransferase Ste14